MQTDLRDTGQGASCPVLQPPDGLLHLDIARRRCTRCGQGGTYQLKTGVTYQLQLLSDFLLCIYGKLGVLHFLDPRLLGQLIHIQPNVPSSCIGKPRNRWATASRQWVSSEKRLIFSEPLTQRPVGTFKTVTLTNGRRRGSVAVVASPHSPRVLSSLPGPLPLTGDGLLALTATM